MHTKEAEMDLRSLKRKGDCEWEVPKRSPMRVPGVIFGSAAIVKGMEDKVIEQLSNVAALPGIVEAAYAMPDAHWGYGFPIGGVAAFDPEQGGVISAGGVGFDISCGVRALTTGLQAEDLDGRLEELADTLFELVPAGVGSRSNIKLRGRDMEGMLRGGARWAVEQGYGYPEDLERIEDGGAVAGAEPGAVSPKAKERMRPQLGTLGSGNHYAEVQVVDRIDDAELAKAFSLREGGVVVSIHCGSRGLGHQINTEMLKKMVAAAPKHGLDLPDRELACAPIRSSLGETYLGAMRAGINCALANRQVLSVWVREAFLEIFGEERLELLYDVSHNTCKEEDVVAGGRKMRLFVHRKGATRAFGPGHPELPQLLRPHGQPVIVGGTMGTASYILCGKEARGRAGFSSACHGAGRAMSRSKARKLWNGRDLLRGLAHKGVLVRTRSFRGAAEEAPSAYKDVDEVVRSTEAAGLSRSVARLRPRICVKG
jgi:tRNA-splicing ligase RtcB (3'-phosphate/5'-hydroxy nucleic acid ligase)